VRRVALRAVSALLVFLSAGVTSSGAEVSSPGCPPPAATSSAGVAPTPPAPAGAAQPTPEQVLVCVSSQAITGATYSHWLTVAKDAQGSLAKGQHAASAAELQSEVLGFLISSDWVIGEAKDLNVAVSAAEVKKQFDHIRRAQFPKHRGFEAFLRESGETVADLLLRVELNLLSERIQKHVVAGHHSAASKQRALSRFVKGFKMKWQAQTYCAAEYDVADCGHVQAAV
jgi:hypothetical protein